MSGELRRWLVGNGTWQTPLQRATGTYVIGQPGVGKTGFIKTCVMQDIRARHGVGVLDPAGDLYSDLSYGVAALLHQNPHLAERIVLFNPPHPRWTVGFNPLQPLPGVPTERLASSLTDAIVKLWKMDASETPRTMRLLTFTLLALAESNRTLLDLPAFLTQRGFRERLVRSIDHEELKSYFLSEFPKTDGGSQQWISPVLTRIGKLIFDPDLRLVLGAKSTINLRRILDGKVILLINLPKGILGDGNSSLLAGLLVAYFQQAALSRADTRRVFRSPFFLYLDEFQNYTTDNIQVILAEARKYGLSLTLAHQYLEQLPAHLKGAVLNTTGTIVCFRVGYHDADELAKEVFPVDSIREPRRPFELGRELDLLRLSHYPVPFFREEREPLKHQKAISLLTNQKAREFWAKVRGPSAPVRLHTIDMPEPKLTAELVAAHESLINLSGQRYGRLKSEVRDELRQRRDDHDTPSASYYEKP